MSKYKDNETLLNYKCFRELHHLEGDFFRGLEIFYLEKGYLTPKQREAVDKAIENQRDLYDILYDGLDW